ncbi:hypothetical protein S40288_09150 [Stachybotrys chartarum IBT 40288]|nr:hypothetical protein S40288_09150 [Stachybotrys chartarum IBT 40288]
MAHSRLGSKLSSMIRWPRQSSSPQPLPAPSQLAAKPAATPAVQVTSQPLPSPTTSKDINTRTPPNLQERIWNQAYDNLKESEPKVVDAFERILSAELQPNESHQMQQLVQNGLERTKKVATVKRGTDEGLQAVQAVRGIVNSAMVSNPITEANSNRQGIIYILSRVEWYWALVDLLFDENKVDRSSEGLRFQLENSIAQLYEKLLLYQMKSICLYRRHWLSTIRRDLLKFDDWTGQLVEINDSEAAVQRDMAQYNTEESKRKFGQLIDSARVREESLQAIRVAIQGLLQQQEKRHRDEEDEQCLKALYSSDPRMDKKRIQETKGGLLRDSYHWILEHTSFQQFSGRARSGLLWIKGDPGKGKTMLLCGIIDELEKNSKNCLSYFFCQATETRLDNATAVLQGLVYSLACQYPQLVSYIREEHKKKGEKLLEINAWQVLTELLTSMLNDPVLDAAILMVDALDECTSGRPELLDFIIGSSTSVRWILSSRNWHDIEEKLGNAEQGTRLDLELNNKAIHNAVEAYVRYKVERLAETKRYKEETKATVRHKLLANANDTFLWVALVYQELEQVEEWDVDDVLKELPSGLEGLYGRMIQQIQQLKRKDPERCSSVLATVSTAYRPLYLEELGHLAGLPSAISSSTTGIHVVVTMCGSFLAVRDGIVYIIHQSAKDFLSSNTYIFPSGMEDQHDRLFSRSLDHLSVTLKGNMYRLPSPGSSIDEISPPSPDPLASARYSCIHWPNHFLESRTNAIEGRDQSLVDGGTIDLFFQQKYLNWLEALSLFRSLAPGVIAMERIETFLKHTGAPALYALVKDARRFILSQKGGIEISPLQVYASALIFSPTSCMIRRLYSREEPDWIEMKPQVEPNWNACLQTLEGHDSSVESVVFSPDGQRLASGSHDKTVKIWDTTSGNCIQTLSGHDGWVTSVVFSPDGQRLASGSYDNTVKIWDSTSGDLVFSPDRQRLASCSCDKTVKIWDATSGDCIQTFSGHNDLVTSVVFSPDGQRLASGSYDNKVKIWDATSGDCIQILSGYDGTVTSVVFSPGGQRLASGLGYNIVKIWDATSGDYIQTLSGHNDLVTSVVFSPDGQRLVSGSYDNTVKIWDSTSGDCIQTFSGHNDPVTSVVFSPDGQRLASCSCDKTVKIWDSTSGDCIQISSGHNDPVTSVVFSPDGQRLASVSWDKTVKIWDATSGDYLQTFSGHDDPVTSVVFSSNGQRLASGSCNKIIKIWDSTSGDCIQTLSGHNDLVTSVVFSPNGQQLASGSCDKTVKIWDSTSGDCIQTFPLDRIVYSLSFDPTNNTRLCTEVGALDIALSPSSALQLIDDESSYDSTRSGYDISGDAIWIVKGLEKVLWIPPEYRPVTSAVSGSTIGIGFVLSQITEKAEEDSDTGGDSTGSAALQQPTARDLRRLVDKVVDKSSGAADRDSRKLKSTLESLQAEVELVRYVNQGLRETIIHEKQRRMRGKALKDYLFDRTGPNSAQVFSPAKIAQARLKKVAIDTQKKEDALQKKRKRSNDGSRWRSKKLSLWRRGGNERRKWTESGR